MQTIITDDRENSLALTIQQNDLADMILNFLGKKEILTYKEENINFEVRRNDIEQFYYLLNGKITKELNSSITHFSVVFFYHDNTSREINEIETLNTFLELRDVLPIKIILSWNIILSFPNTQKIENQEIYVDFDMSNIHCSTSILIKHTNPVWGAEVLNLFKEHTKTLLTKKPKVLVFSEKIIKIFQPREVLLLLNILVIILSLILIFSNISKESQFNDLKVNLVSKLIQSENNHSISNLEIGLISNTILERNDNKKIIQLIQDKEIKRILSTYYKDKDKDKDKDKYNYLIIGTYLAFLFTIYFLLRQNIKYLSEESFILTTKRAEKAYELYEKSKSKTEYYSVTLIAFSIITGLIVNGIFQLMN